VAWPSRYWATRASRDVVREGVAHPVWLDAPRHTGALAKTSYETSQRLFGRAAAAMVLTSTVDATITDALSGEDVLVVRNVAGGARRQEPLDLKDTDCRQGLKATMVPCASRTRAGGCGDSLRREARGTPRRIVWTKACLNEPVVERDEDRPVLGLRVRIGPTLKRPLHVFAVRVSRVAVVDVLTVEVQAIPITESGLRPLRISHQRQTIVAQSARAACLAIFPERTFQRTEAIRACTGPQQSHCPNNRPRTVGRTTGRLQHPERDQQSCPEGEPDPRDPPRSSVRDA